MPRSYSNLWKRVVAWKHLLESYERCRRRKRHKFAAYQFHQSWESHLIQLQSELIDGSWTPGEYHHFRISDPKPRVISAAPFRDRIVHHAVVGVLDPIFESRFIYDSYACRIGKGTHKAIRRAQYYMRRHEWCLKTDIVQFFPNVDHEILTNKLERQIKDRALLRLVAQILNSGLNIPTMSQTPFWFPGDSLFAVLRSKGLPIGNLTSQFFANVYLDSIDHYIKEELGVPGYIRYADDLLLFGRSKSQLWDWRCELQDHLAKIRLRLHKDKTVVAPCRKGIKYLGFRVLPFQRRATQQSIRRFNRKKRRWQYEYQQRMRSLPEIHHSVATSLSHLQFANTIGIRRELLRKFRLRRNSSVRRRSV